MYKPEKPHILKEGVVYLLSCLSIQPPVLLSGSNTERLQHGCFSVTNIRYYQHEQVNVAIYGFNVSRLYAVILVETLCFNSELSESIYISMYHSRYTCASCATGVKVFEKGIIHF